MPTTKVDEVEIYYEVYGDGEPLILIAGFMGDHTVWGGMLETLAKRFKVLIFDNRAVGQTQDSGKPFSIETLADDAIKLSQQVGFAKPHILGQSMGGAVAQTIAMKYPQQINSLIILNSVMKFSVVSQIAMTNLLDLEALKIPADLILNAILPWVLSSDFLSVPDNIKMLKKMVMSNPYPQSTENKKRQLAAIELFDSRPWANQIKTKTLVIAGEHDVLTPPAQCCHLANQIPQAIFKIIPGAHASPTEQPEKVTNEILAFLM